MRTAIVTDSNSGISEAEGRQIGVFVVPMPIMMDGTSYYEGQNLSHETFFRCLKEDRIVSTSQPDMGEVLLLWNKILRSGYDELVYIPMSSGLSGSCRNAQSFAREYGQRIQVVDNRRISVTLRHAVQDALSLRQKGCNAHEIKERLERSAGDSIIYVGVNTLKYLKAGGRITPAGAAVGTVFNIRPLLVIEGGRLDAYAKVRGFKSCQRRLIQAVQTHLEQLSAGGGRVQIGVADSFIDPQNSAAWKRSACEAFPGYDVKYDPLTCSIAGHVGPDAFGMGISSSVKA